MRYLTVEDVVYLHRRLMDASGGAHGILNAGALDSAVAQPQMSFGGNDLYPSLCEKAAAIGYSLVMNHAFADGNKRTGSLRWKKCFGLKALKSRHLSKSRKESFCVSPVVSAAEMS